MTADAPTFVDRTADEPSPTYDPATLREFASWVERDLVAGQWSAHAQRLEPFQRAAALSVLASRFLAASSPHSLGVIVPHGADAQAPGPALALWAAFQLWFSPRDLRLAAATAPAPFRAATEREAAAADIVVVVGSFVPEADPTAVPMAASPALHAATATTAWRPRRGSHVLWLSTTPPPFRDLPADSLCAYQSLTDAAATTSAAAPAPGPWLLLRDIVAGRIDGRQLDEVSMTWIDTRGESAV